ncbi:uncharacterized protein J3D65DRAFT_611500 [Phyllosticta citribraziliensis]|uniref:Uncharacterized protein n=1 Tax=Phyllosticta citribraziliensis TaxID=989973 RepID=A0ABR1MAV5_9PEZI
MKMHVANFGSTTAAALIATLVTAPLVGALPVDAPPNPLPLTASPTDLLPHINSPSPFEKRDASWTAYPTVAVPTPPALTTEAPFMTLSRLHSGDGDNRIWIPSTKEIRSSGYPPARMGKRGESTPTLKEHVPAKALPDRIVTTLPSPAEPEAKIAVGLPAPAVEAKKTRKRCRVYHGRRICDRGPDYADGIVAGGHSDKKHHTKRKHSDRDHHESDNDPHRYDSDKDHHPSYLIKENNLQRREDGEIPTPLPLPLSAKPDANIYKRKWVCGTGIYACPTHSDPPTPTHSDADHHKKKKKPKHSDKDHHHSDKDHHFWYMIRKNHLPRQADGEIPTPQPLPLSAKPDANIYKRKVPCGPGTGYACPTHSHPPTPIHSDADHHKKKKPKHSDKDHHHLDSDHHKKKKPKHSDKDHHHSDSDHHKKPGWWPRLMGHRQPKYQSDRFGRKAINTTDIANFTRQSEVAPGADLRSVGYYTNNKPSAGGLKEKLFGNSTRGIVGDVIDSIRGNKNDNETNNATGSIVDNIANSSTAKKDDKQHNSPTNGLLGNLVNAVKQKRGKVWHGWHTHDDGLPEKPPVITHGYHTHPNEIYGETIADCPLRKREIELENRHKQPIPKGNAVSASASGDNGDLGQRRGVEIRRPGLPGAKEG